MTEESKILFLKKKPLYFFLTLFFSLRNANKIDSEFSVAYFVLSFCFESMSLFG